MSRWEEFDLRNRLYNLFWYLSWTENYNNPGIFPGKYERGRILSVPGMGRSEAIIKNLRQNNTTDNF